MSFLLLAVIYGLYHDSAYAKSLKLDTRIVGGKAIDIRSAPYQVSIQVGKNHVCGGALILPSLVVSAAHCFYSNPYAMFYNVRAGSNTINNGGVYVAAKKITIHEGYSQSGLEDDIALVELAVPLPVSDTIRPINVSANDDYTPNSMAWVSGWGHEKENGSLAAQLMRAEVPITSRVYCRSKYKSLALVTEKMVCAGYREGGADACQGDSGGPLVLNGRLIGTVSFGMGCAREYPGVYCNVAKYVTWIADHSNYTAASASGFVKSGQTFIFLALTLTIVVGI